MPETVIRAEGLSKVYPLTASTRRRLLYVLGLTGWQTGTMPTRSAIAQLDLEIRRGEKVGIIGRNGSGKSTLLGMISGTIEPSQGRLDVHGTIHALLQLGAGFNEDLTGRENACSYLAMQGVSGREADDRVAEIAEFAEIGVYFDQPIRTYSSGMRLRLIFAAATSISPDILILDEVLSVGDAYFIGKSFDRIRQLCAGEGTTLLVVSHAVNMLPELCDRIIWIDNGVVRLDGEPETVARAYESFVRAEEENRLRRLQAEQPIRQLVSMPGEPESPDSAGPDVAAAGGGIIGEIRMPDGQPPGHRLIVSRIEFLCDGNRIVDIPIGADPLGDGVSLLTAEGVGNWGPYDSERGGREFRPYGSPFHKLPFRIDDPALREALGTGNVTVRLHCHSAMPCVMALALHVADPPALRSVSLEARGSSDEVLIGDLGAPAMDSSAEDDARSSLVTGRFGTRRIEFLAVDFLGEDERSRFVYTTGGPLRVCLRYRINDPVLDENAEVVLAFQKDGLLVTNRFFLDEYRFSASAQREGEILLDVTPLLLLQGEYTVSVAVHAAGHVTRKTPRESVSVSQGVYDMFYRYFRITVFEPYHTTLLKDVIFQHPATWTIGAQKYRSRIVTD